MFHQQKTNKENDSQEGKQIRKDLHLLVEEGRKIMGGIVTESLRDAKHTSDRHVNMGGHGSGVVMSSYACWRIDNN